MDAEILGEHSNQEKRARYFENEVATLSIVKREALANVEDAERIVEQVYTMQDGERHRFDLLVQLVQQSIREKRVLEQDELDRVKRLQWNEAAAALAASKRDAQGRDVSAEVQGSAQGLQSFALSEALAASRATLGDRHPNTLAAIQHLGSLLQAQG